MKSWYLRILRSFQSSWRTNPAKLLRLVVSVLLVVGIFGLVKALTFNTSSAPKSGSFRFDRNASTLLPTSQAERFNEMRVRRFPDKFPAIVDPVTVSAVDASFLADDSEVLGIVIDDHPRAYPTLYVSLHHIVNDTINGSRITLTYCSNCSSGVAFNAAANGRRMMFGVMGIWQGSLLMYDHKTNSEWLHLTGECVKGQLTGTKLPRIPIRHVLWSEWKQQHPSTDVMKPIEGVEYWPSEDIRRGSGSVTLLSGRTLVDVSNRLDNAELVLGVEIGNDAIAYSIQQLTTLDSGLVNDHSNEEPIVVGLNPDTKSPFAYSRRLSGRTLKFIRQDNATFRETTTQSVFDHSGRCLSGELQNQKLEPVASIECAWYGWYASRPHTRVWEPDAK